MPHFPGLRPEIRQRLAERGIDPERSLEAGLDAIREGRAPLRLLWAILGDRCASCGIEYDLRTAGCQSCSSRHYRRRARQAV